MAPVLHGTMGEVRVMVAGTGQWGLPPIECFSPSLFFALYFHTSFSPPCLRLVEGREGILISVTDRPLLDSGGEGGSQWGREEEQLLLECVLPQTMFFLDFN